MIRTIVTTAIIAIAATTASAEKCGFLCKLAYGGGHDTVAEAKAAWEDKSKASAAERMEATGKSVLVSGNYVYVNAGDVITMVAKNDLSGKSKEGIKETILNAVKDELTKDILATQIAGGEAEIAKLAEQQGLSISEVKHDIVQTFKEQNGLIEGFVTEEEFNKAKLASGATFAQFEETVNHIDKEADKAAAEAAVEAAEEAAEAAVEGQLTAAGLMESHGYPAEMAAAIAKATNDLQAKVEAGTVTAADEQAYEDAVLGAHAKAGLNPRCGC